MGGGLSDSFNSAKNNLNDQFNSTKSNLNGNWNQIKDMPSNTWNDAKNDVSNQWEQAKSNPLKYATNPNTANQINGINTLKNSYNSIEKPISQSFQGIQNGFGSGMSMNGVTPNFNTNGLHGQLVAALNSAPTAASVQGR